MNRSIVVLLVAVSVIVVAYVTYLLTASQVISLDKVKTARFNDNLIATQIIVDENPEVTTIVLWIPIMKEGTRNYSLEVNEENSRVEVKFWCPVKKKYQKFIARKKNSATKISTKEESFEKWKKVTIQF